MAIHPLVWLTVGTLVAMVSYIIGDSLRLFFYVGIAFVAIGVVSGIIRLLMREEVSSSQMKQYICYRCKGPVQLGMRQCPRCRARLNPRHGQ